MKREEALNLLGLEQAVSNLTPQIVAEAFRARVKQAHPDTASAGESRGESNESQTSVQLLTIARKTLLESLDGTDLCCRLCSGRGIVRSSMGWRKCVACKGTGERR